jgi:chaperonin GroEL (HSP60 family)
MVTSILLEKNPVEELNEYIVNAMKKVDVQKETDLSRYIPGRKGHLHHFAFVKLKKTSPTELQQLIQEYIVDKENPEPISSAPKPALKMKRTVELTIKKSMINQLLNALKISKVEGAEDLIAMLTPHQTLGQVQKLMLDMIREKEVDAGLWETYVKLVEEERAIAQ